MNPAVSVILPVFNGDKYLSFAIESILSQSFKDFELIILNDGSTDSSLPVIKSFASQDPRVVVVDRENRGLVASLNEGLRLAKAELIARMDADDICLENRFLKQVNYLNLNPNCVAVGCKILLIDPDGLPIMEMSHHLNHADIDAGNMSGCGSFIAHPAVMMRRKAVLDVGGYRDEFRQAQDVDLFLRLAEVGRLSNLSQVLLNYRQHLNSVGYAHSQAQMRCARNAAIKACHRRKLPIPPGLLREDTGGTIQNVADVHRKWAWWSLSGGNVATARKHLMEAFHFEPFSPKNWKLLMCVLRGF